MKCESFSMISDLVDYLNNNLLTAHFCGFDISRPLPSYWTFDRFLKRSDNEILSAVMKAQVLLLAKKGIVDTSFIGLGSTPAAANTSQNNPKSFLPDKFKPDNQPKAEVHDAAVALDILADTHSFLPITECTSLADNGYDAKNIYNQVKGLYDGECIIPLNKRTLKLQICML